MSTERKKKMTDEKSEDHSVKQKRSMEENEMKLRKVTAMLAVAVMGSTMFMTGCGSDDSNNSGDKVSKDTAITVISREEGSGTRGAFVELLGVVDENDNDITVATAEITQSTSVMLTTVADNPAAIGYVSLGALNDKVKAAKVDGVEATVDNVKNGSYKLSRPFNIAVKESLSDEASDFVDFIMSKEGQAIIEEEGYISVGSDESYTASGVSGKITLAGSTSVGPVMEVLAEKYMELNPDANVEVQQTGSSAGMTSTIEDACDIGMASRAVKDSEKEQGLQEITIAIDGIAVIVNKDNELGAELTSEQIKNIYLGEITKWSLE